MSDGPRKTGDKRRQPDDSYGQVTQPGTFRIERLLPGPIERVWSYLTEPEKRRRWFGGGPMELRAGGEVKLQFKFAELSAEKTPSTKAGECEVPGRVTRCDPPRLLSYTWGSAPDASEVTFELTSRGKNVLLVITHRRLTDRGAMVSVASGWHTHLGILTDLLNGGELRPFWATKISLEEQYLERFATLGRQFFIPRRQRRCVMAIYQTGGYHVKSSAVDKVKQAIKDFVRYVQENEPGTKMYLAWQEKSDPTRFLHLFIFEDAAAQARHGQSDAVKRFESVYSPELVGGEVIFTDYELVSGKPTGEQWAKFLGPSKSSK